MRVEEIVDRVVARFIGTKHERDVKRLTPAVEAINALASECERLSDAELKSRAQQLNAEVTERLSDTDPAEPEYKQRLQEALEPAMAPAFALVREAGRRTLGLRHFDVQLIGGMVLHEGKIAEMKTGEGKTLVATLPAFLNALAGRGVHIVTVNDYLARRDAEWMGPIYRALGLTVGVIVHDLDEQQRRAAYAADITYGTNNEFGFDYLRDNMKYDLGRLRPARPPVRHRGRSGLHPDRRGPHPADHFRPGRRIHRQVLPHRQDHPQAHRGDRLHHRGEAQDRHAHRRRRRQGASGCWAWAISTIRKHMEMIHHVYQGLRAHTLYKRDVDYVVKNNEVIIVDEFTGREMPGRRWSDGLHQAVEAKEGVKIERENQTLATITFQNYFRMYKKLSGMTGTAETEAPEFNKIYNLEVVAIPTNRQLMRNEYSDVVYRTAEEKYEAVVNGMIMEDGSHANGIRQLHESGQPVLVGTISIEKSEHLADSAQESRHPASGAQRQAA